MSKWTEYERRKALFCEKDGDYEEFIKKLCKELGV
jgi:hypothetical protein